MRSERSFKRAEVATSVRRQHDRNLDARELRRRRLYRAKFPIAYALSYLVDGVFLTLFALAGTVSAWVPGVFVATGICIAAVFFHLIKSGYSDRFRDRYLTLAQVFVSTLILLLFFAYTPSVGFIFLGAFFIISGFGSLRLSVRESALIGLVMVGGTGVIFYFSPAESYFLEPSPRHIAIAWSWFAAILIRLSVLGMIGNSLRIAIQARQKELAESEQLFKQAAEVAHLGHWHFDELKGEYSYISEEYARIHAVQRHVPHGVGGAHRGAARRRPGTDREVRARVPGARQASAVDRLAPWLPVPWDGRRSNGFFRAVPARRERRHTPPRS